MDYAIIVAGGKGTRMGGDIPKQFLLLGGVPVLMHTVRRFHDCCPALKIILVLPKEQHQYWETLCRKYHFDVECQVADGGETRFHSIQNGLSLIPDNEQGVVGIHDGVRPFPSFRVIEDCYETARRCGAAVPVMPVVETIRHREGETSVTVPRNEYCMVQTPQTFDIQVHKQAYAQPYCKDFTDDASVVESLGHPVALVEGNRENIKITTPFDMVIAETLVRKKPR
ncbi:MAG: 2-C-methyl-D-erythritol 4-phosphate cytidylyltransferase [Prevotella sp.]|nr:2-C-methyl-D-erythritol 4-phosphate cytidylyltransferase [Prevotella sp.]